MAGVKQSVDDLPSISQAGNSELRGGVDPDLLSLPGPPRWRRFATMTVMALVVAVALGFAGSLAPDVSYYFASSTAVDLGEVTEIAPSSLRPNEYVRITGTPMASGTVYYSRLLGSGEHAVSPFAGQRRVYVQVPIADRRSAGASVRRDFTGRLVTFGDLGGRFEPVRRYLERRMGMPVSADSYLLMADEPPGHYAWALGLVLLCLLVAVVDLALLLRWFRPIREVAADDDADDLAAAA